MSADALPITPARFAEALTDLSPASLHLKVLELRNSIAHLDYSNEQLRPFAEGIATVLGQQQQTGPPDQDCVDAIRENEAVIARMQERIRLVRAEVESRGFGWAEFQSKEEAEAEAEATNGAASEQAAPTNGVNGTADGHSAWSDGTFQTGTIRNGVARLDGPESGSTVSGASQQTPQGGSLTDEELRRRLEQQLGSLEDDEGMHL